MCNFQDGSGIIQQWLVFECVGLTLFAFYTTQTRRPLEIHALGVPSAVTTFVLHVGNQHTIDCLILHCWKCVQSKASWFMSFGMQTIGWIHWPSWRADCSSAASSDVPKVVWKPRSSNPNVLPSWSTQRTIIKLYLINSLRFRNDVCNSWTK